VSGIVAVVDYGAGNLTSVVHGLTAAGGRVCVATDPGGMAGAAGLVVPGVGHFGATAALGAEWRRAILAHVADGRPLLGICLGMQWLFEGSDEAPEVSGLGVMPGRIVKLRSDPGQRLKVPHVGWNALDDVRGGARLLQHVPTGSQVYFTHSFAAPVTAACVASTTHANTFASVVERDNVFGVQFHPEKSGGAGLQILRNFLETVRPC
jgi:glutamine amidotransferase